ncbi:S-layer homology domain-containing protein [Brevibacillus sp. GCM10020057]|uniref:S-layer homology domain-containing protein n=1 Tax=Brevibacillus sp. GCM10020057 TaxID=3317327 RepID=UPI00362853CE
MKKAKIAPKWALGVSAALVFAPSFSVLPAVPVAYAAELSTPQITKEQAVQLAGKWITVPDGYKQESVTFQDAQRDRYAGQSTWNLSWRNAKNDGGMYMTIDADTGQLLQFSRYDSRTKPSVQAVSAEQAETKATQFLQLVTSEDERKKLSKPNQYGSFRTYLANPAEHVFAYTRMENNLPFLENGFIVVVNGAGEINSFTRQWSKAPLPAPDHVVSREQAEKLLAEKTAPSLRYKDMAGITGNYQTDSGRYMLVYGYSSSDPRYVDAVAGTVVNAQGKPAASKPVQPLGTSRAGRVDAEKRVTKEQAQQIAEQLIKKLPGQYRSDGSHGGGVSTGANGIEIRSWSFTFTPLQAKDKAAEPVHVSINDRGQLEEFTRNDRVRFREKGTKIEKAVPWKTAEESAVQLVKTFYADRLGEIYLLDQEPSDRYIKEVLEHGGPYAIRFGWLKDGVPLEDADFTVEVNPQTGEAETMWVRAGDLPEQVEADGERVIDASTAKKVEQEQKTLALTYFQPQAVEFALPDPNAAPLLVYRYVGEEGVVDAQTGEWISFAQERKKQRPQDIAGHPLQAAVEDALRMGLMVAKDGKFEPDKPVTRGEMAQLMLQMTNRIEFHSLHFHTDEDEIPFTFADVGSKHPQYGAIQRALQYGLIEKKGTRFEPDKAITRAQAADMTARLLGYGDLLKQPALFVSAFSDVRQADVPAVAIIHSLGLLPGQNAAFSPDSPLTRAEAAQLLQGLLTLKQEKE